ncbi:uncharacterized protein BDZ99DRAFT_522249 [Mytilinidion resinicola]|uniref:Uncharacterized protein n=1 Tax=Mytilinidion resinicola TaxID=574789 RepID=A0A6A6YI02_9PEZI|nr:uncharacterized protein BDZ99DRAFT_522249 [Mytilinidion resinicola]KAF2807624.1 hypothetical protein BDZ99DRAFT_522249 [Mytilinidion resinicola]
MSLPTRLKIDIRDNWSKDDTKLQKSQKALSDLVGYKINCEPEWHMLWAEMQPHCPDTSTFIPSVCAIVSAWCDALTTLLDDEKNEKWADKVLEELSKTNRVKIRLEVLPNPTTPRPTATWTAPQSAFTIYLPKGPLALTSALSSGFSEDLLACLDPPVDPTPLSQRQVPDDSWADIEVDSTSGTISTRDTAPSITNAQNKGPAAAAAELDTLPDVATLPRPEYLALKPPYHMIITHSPHAKEMSIQCSHPPSLKVVEGYLERWTKRDNNTVNRPPAATLTLHESPFGLGILQDRLTISTQGSRMTFVLSPTLLMSFVEGVLGYALVSGDGGTWTFRRDVGFKS